MSAMSILLGLSSCDDFLTTTPNDAPTRNVFLDNRSGCSSWNQWNVLAF